MGRGTKSGPPDPPSFGAEEATSDAHDSRTFERNVPDPAAEKRRAYAPGKKVSEGNKPAASESTGRNAPRRVYSARASQSAPEERGPTPGSYAVQGNYYASAASQASPPTTIPDEYYIQSEPTMARPISARVVEDEEADIEARVQERVERQSQQIAQQIREELAHGNASVGGTGAASGTSVGSGERDKDDATCCGYSKSVVVGLVILAIVLVGAAIGAAVALSSSSSPGESPTPAPTFVSRGPPSLEATSAPTIGAAPGPSPTPEPQMCTLCADGTVPDGLDGKIVNEDDGTTCAEFAATTATVDSTNDACPANQALAWALCGCPTLPPPAEDPPCTLCEGGAAMVGITAGGCDDLQTMTGLVSTAFPLLSCDTYLDAAAIAGCECPEGPIVGSSTAVPSAPPISDSGSTVGFTPNPTPPPAGSPATPSPAGSPGTLSPAASSGASCTLCEDGTIPDGLDEAMIGTGENEQSCAEFAVSVQGLDPTDALCDVNQAAAWLYCGCPTLPPPVENPTCTLCENGAEPVGANAGLCSDLQTFTGITSSTLNSFTFTCSQYLQVAAAGNCVCPEGAIQA